MDVFRRPALTSCSPLKTSPVGGQPVRKTSGASRAGLRIFLLSTIPIGLALTAKADLGKRFVH